MRSVLHDRRGSNLIEFTLVGVPLIFILISIFEMARGMWMYETLAHAVREGTRFAVVHGQGCATDPNDCRRTVGQIAERIRDAGVGLDANLLNVTIASNTRTIACNPLSTCLAQAVCFPTAAACDASVDWGASTGMPITVEASFPFSSGIAMFWPGGGSGRAFGTKLLRASSRETIQF